MGIVFPEFMDKMEDAMTLLSGVPDQDDRFILNMRATFAAWVLAAKKMDLDLKSLGLV